MITIIDTGGANLASIQFAFARLGVVLNISHDVDIIKKSSRVILPGVGSASASMAYLQQRKLCDVIRSLTQPVLGICLGMQLLYDFSEEGNTDCLKIISGRISRINQIEDLVVPHMGWNTINIMQNDTVLKNVANDSYMYFVHSYVAPLSTLSIASFKYGCHYTAAVQDQNYIGMQFHPEKSGDVGLTIIKNFLES